MMIAKYIQSLLTEHDCVILPQFGGFVASYAPATIHPTQHLFAPPSKKVMFNKNLNANDGLLANTLVNNEGFTYNEALQQITIFVQNIKQQLQQGTKFTIDEVGTLYLDIERNICFEPSATNLLLDSFGLAPFQSPAIKRGNIAQRIEKEFKDRPAIAAERKPINYKRIATVAALIPILFLMIWLPLKTDVLKDINYAALNPFAKNTEVPTQVKIAPLNTNKPIEAIKQDTTPLSEIKAPEAIADTTHVETNQINTEESSFHLVVGCFQIEENAINFAKELNNKNQNANIIGKNNKGLFVVSCGDFPSKKQAVQELSNLRKLQPSAWLYHN
jgi:cell division septation protein DedD